MGFPIKDTFTETLPPPPPSRTTMANNGNNMNNNNNTITNDENNIVSLEETYTSLIQEYLQVMCYENAIFLAERFVASYPSSSNALYMLAICHYKSGATKRALMVLDDIRHYESSRSTTILPAADYLKARCCYDLEYYGRAEDTLLHVARSEYKLLLSSGSEAMLNNNNLHNIKSMNDWIVETTPCPIPNGAVGLHLLGDICRKSSRKERAMKYYRMALQLDPLLWTSFEALCELGATDIDPTTIFGVRPAQIDQLQAQLHQKSQNNTTTTMPLQQKSILSPSLHFGQGSHHHNHNHGTPVDSSLKPLQPMDLASPSTLSSIPKTSLFQTAQKQKVTPNQLQFETPNLTPIPHQHDGSFLNASAQSSLSFLDSHNPNTVRRAKHIAARMYYAPSPETPEWNKRPNTTTKSTTSQQYFRGRSSSMMMIGSSISDTPLRRGGGRPSEISTTRRPRTLFHSENKTNNNQLEDLDDDDDDDTNDDEIVLSRSSQTENESKQRPSDDYGGGRKLRQLSEKRYDPTDSPSMDTAMADDDDNIILDRHGSVESILELFCLMGAGYWKLCQYRCREALQLFQSLPHEQHNTGWVLHQEGRAFFEMANYQNAQRSLELMQRVEPHRLKGLELLSTVLWQLKKEVEIAHLAQKVVDFDRLAPEAWCVVGNCFSLQKEHETALVFFSRSLQLNPSFTYVHTLSGYEYMANEDFEKAVACFRNAIRSDERHYNAWYGIGAIYHRQEKFDLAEYHFHRAVTINPQSSVLRCNLGMSQYSNGKPLQALDTLEDAFRLDPHNPQARFQRATIYVSLNRPEDALKELERVRDAAPREATIHFAMGKVLKRLGRPEQAMRCFLTALDLDPKDNQLIKSAMDKLDEPDVDEEVTAF